MATNHDRIVSVAKQNYEEDNPELLLFVEFMDKAFPESEYLSPDYIEEWCDRVKYKRKGSCDFTRRQVWEEVFEK